MKKLISASIFVAAMFVATPAFAQGCGGRVGSSYVGPAGCGGSGPWSNSDANHPGIYYQGQYYPYGYVPNQVQVGRTKREKDPENRDQFCGNGVGWVPYGKPCPENLADGRFIITKVTRPDGSVETTYTPR